MKNPYIPARMRPSAGLPEPFMKNETVIGTIGKTQGVKRAAKPHRMASMISPHSEPPPAASFCAGAISAAGVVFLAAALSLDGVSAGCTAGVAPAGRVIVSSVSSGGRQLVSLQIIHASSAVTVACGAVSFTLWANCAFRAKVPISIPNVLS